MEKVNIGSFWNVFLKEDEEKSLIQFLKENEYPPNKEGLKEFILDSIKPEEKPKTIKEILEENPEIKTLGQIGGQILAKSVRKKLFGK